MGGGHLRVAIVGVGPKGLYALERLVARAGTGAGTLEIDLFEPHPNPGAGPVYDPGQPPYLRMNFAAGLVDMWPGGEGTSFVEWRRDRPQIDASAYPARAAVGEYLSDGFTRVCERARAAGIEVRVHRRGVRAVECVSGTKGWGQSPRGQSPWRINGGGDAYDEVLVAVGHAPGWSSGLDRGPWSHQATLVPRVFPVGETLGPDRVPPGATVAIRGLALTMIDAALALTEGRDGRFDANGNSGHFTYEPGEADAGVILPFSRTGRPMLAKPDPDRMTPPPGLDVVVERACAQIREAPGLREVRAALGEGADALVDLAAGGSTFKSSARDLLAEACAGGAIRSPLSARDELEESVAVGLGLAKPGLFWAIGETWRGAYPAIVERVGGAGLSEAEWGGFRLLAAEMERLAFGPPPVNAAKLLALIDHGTVSLTHLDGALAETESGTVLRSGSGETPVDVVVDGVLPGPGAAGVDHPLLRQLLEAGHVRVPVGRRGLELDADGTVIGRDGRRSEGLAAVGRPTEDWVIGNDTLSRKLHPEIDRWAHRVAARVGT